MLAKMRPWVGVLSGWFFLMLPVVAQAENYALLVGVSDYPQKGRALEGPRNDVALMWNMLTERGFDPANITVLADGLEARQVESEIASHGLPTRAAILAALGKLAETAQAEDVVFIHFSGHGAVQPDASGDEPDHRDEIFLPIDIGQWNEETQGVENAIVDDELASILAAINAKGAFVWAVFDQCNAGTAARGRVDDIRVRAVPAENLGIPDNAFASSRGGSDPTPEPLLSAGNTVAFYAVHTGEVALERHLPRGATSGAHASGVFTWAIVSALRQGGIESYRDLARAVLQIAQGLAPGSPLFEGNMDQRIFSEAPAARKLIAVTSPDGLALRAGWLDGVVENAVLALYPLGADEAAGPVAHVLAYDVTYTSAALTPDTRDGRLGVDMTTLPDMTEARFAERPLDLTLRVAMDPDTLGGDGIGKALRAAIKALDAGSAPAPDAAARIEWVDTAADADYVLERSEDHLLFADQAGKSEPAERLTIPAIRVPGSESGEAGRLAGVIGDALQRLAKARNIFRYGDAISPEEKIGEALVVESFVYREPQPLPPLATDGPPDNRPCRRFHKSRVLEDMQKLASDVLPPRLGHCDILVFALRNQGERALDVTGLYVDRGGGISSLHDNNPARLHPDGPATHMFARIGTWNTRTNTPLPIGVEKIAFIAVEQPPRTAEIADFRVLAQTGLTPVVRAEQSRVSIFAAQILQAAFPTRSNMVISSERERAEIRAFAVRVVAPSAQMP